MGTISFKDIGIKKNDLKDDVLRRNQSPVPVGIKTPLELDDSGKEIFALNYNVQDQIRDNLRNLVLTNHGERVCLYDFGADLRPLLSEWTNQDDFDSEACLRINTAISKYMPFVTPLEFSSLVDRDYDEPLNKVTINIVYTVPPLNIKRDQITIELYIL
jgi:phage baseplate assembly protein W